MSRWGVAATARAPFLYALDPETGGEPYSDEEKADLIEAIARKHVEQIATGLGILKLDGDGAHKAPSGRRVRLAGDAAKRQFTGAIITPFGRIDATQEQAQELAALLPDPDMIRYVGLDEQILTAYLQGQPLVSRIPERIGDLAMLGADGLVVAPVTQIIDGDLSANLE